MKLSEARSRRLRLRDDLIREKLSEMFSPRLRDDVIESALRDAGMIMLTEETLTSLNLLQEVMQHSDLRTVLMNLYRR
jgi:hypothetical protein